MNVQLPTVLTQDMTIPADLEPIALTFDVILGSTMIVFSEVTDPTILWGFEWDHDLLTFTCAEVDFTGRPEGEEYTPDTMPLFLIEMPDVYTNLVVMRRFKNWLEEQGVSAL